MTEPKSSEEKSSSDAKLNCQEIVRKLNDYLDDALDESICDKVESHIDNCETCLSLINTLRATLDLFERYRESYHDRPMPEELRARLRAYLKEKIPSIK